MRISPQVVAQVQDWSRLLDSMRKGIEATSSSIQCGRVIEVVGTMVKVMGIDPFVGELCELRDKQGAMLQMAEVVGFSKSIAFLSPFGRPGGISRATYVVALGRCASIPVGPGVMGRVMDSLGAPLDGKGPIPNDHMRPVICDPPDPMSRRIIETPLPTGVKVVDGLMTFGEGQRLGVFAPAGVGKSTLMGMFARGARCDVNVIALIGERGREVREFVEMIMGEEGMARSVVICATSDRSSIERSRAAYAATSVAEHLRDQGKSVFLMMDSLTRFARALREIGLAAGEPPARRGFPPSIFAELPRLLERAGMSDRGSITALYTVLAEDESGGDPIAEEVRGILDGHMVLSRDIAAKNQYPAIDILASLSRVMSQVVGEEHKAAAGQVRRLLAKYKEVETLLQVGEYQAGADAVADRAIAQNDAIKDFLCQRTDALQDFEETTQQLMVLGARDD